MKLPIIITNFKAYERAYGRRALELAKIHEKVAKETGVNFVVAVQHTDIAFISSEVSIPVFAQHIDPISFGAGTGRILPEAVKEAGAKGTLINHSEYRVADISRIKKKIDRAEEVDLVTVVCAESLIEAEAFAKLNADFVAIEPPELIGGDISVSKANPDIIRDAVKSIGRDRVIVGAGIKTGEDVRIALKLGACGILLASGITKSEDPEMVLRDLVKGI